MSGVCSLPPVVMGQFERAFCPQKKAYYLREWYYNHMGQYIYRVVRIG